MGYREKFDNLYEEIRIEILSLVQELGKDSDVGFKTIKIHEDYQFNVNDTYMVEIGEDYLFDKYGHSHSFGNIDFEDLCTLVDFLKR